MVRGGRRSLLGETDRTASVLGRRVRGSGIVEVVSRGSTSKVSSTTMLTGTLTRRSIRFRAAVVPHLGRSVMGRLERRGCSLFVFSSVKDPFVGRFGAFGRSIVITSRRRMGSARTRDGIIRLGPRLFKVSNDGSLYNTNSDCLAVHRLSGGRLTCFTLINTFNSVRKRSKFANIGGLVMGSTLRDKALRVRRKLGVISGTSRPVFGSLTCAFSPPLPGVDKSISNTHRFLRHVGLSCKVGFASLRSRRGSLLGSTLVSIGPSVFKSYCAMPGRIPLLHSLRRCSCVLSTYNGGGGPNLNLDVTLNRHSRTLSTTLELRHRCHSRVIGKLR